jgi:hypothetical protein
MTESTYLSDFKENLMRLGYQEAEIPDILDQLDTLLTEIDFLEVKTKIDSAQHEPAKMAGLLQDLMTSLETLGYYRPDIPTPLLKLLINGLIPDIKAASAGPHVFLIIDSSALALFVDFSLDSILEIDVQQTYEHK